VWGTSVAFWRDFGEGRYPKFGVGLMLAALGNLC
jgi:hypothetical protein